MSPKKHDFNRPLRKEIADRLVRSGFEEVIESTQYAGRNDEKCDRNRNIANNVNRARPTAANQISHPNAALTRAEPNERYNSPFENDDNDITERAANLRPQRSETSSVSACKRKTEQD